MWHKQYSFREEYGVGIDPAGLQALWSRMQADPEVLELYLRNMYSLTVGNLDYYDYICEMRYLDDERNSECARLGRAGLHRPALPSSRSKESRSEGAREVVDAPSGSCRSGTNDGILASLAPVLLAVCVILACTTVGLISKLRRQAAGGLSSLHSKLLEVS